MIKKEPRIPTILGLLILVVGIGGGVFLIENFQKTSAKASPSIIPQEIKITNVGHSFFTVSWVTQKKTTGSLNFGNEESLKQIGFDDRDGDHKLREYLTHHVTLRGLKPESTYYFKIISQGKVFDNNGKPFTYTTAPTLATPSSTIEPAYGSVFNVNDQPAEGAIVYLTLGKALPLSTLVKPSGNWLIPLNIARSQDLKNYYSPKEREKIEILVRANLNETAQATTDTLNNSPVPNIVLGKSYDFQRIRTEDHQQLAKSQASEVVLGKTTKVKKVSILTPTEGQSFPSFKPLFKGTGIPNKEIIIVIKSPPQTGKVTVSSDGTWYWTPSHDLTPGEHTITVTTRDENDNLVSLSRRFLVLKSGTQVLGEATPSATLVPSPSPSPFPSPFPSPSPTLFLTASPTATPSAPPDSGNLEPTILIFGISTILIFFGLRIFFLSM